MTSKTKILEIPVEKDFAPNLFLSVIQHDENRLYHKKVSLDVTVEGKEMAIEALFDKKEYRPKETALLTIRAADHEGGPGRADFSVGVVDEAIYYVRQDHTTPIHDFFYAKRSPWVSTTYSFPIRYLGGAVKDAGARVVRKDFRDTAFWMPNLSTDEDGKATVKIPFPDNLTTWVTTIRGHSVTNLFGEKKEKTLVTKPLVTSLKLPRFFIRDDQIEVRVLNYNRTQEPLEAVRNTLKVELPVSIVGPAVRMIQIPKGGTGQLAWPLDVGKGKEKTSITIKTEVGSLFDGEQMTVPVHSRGLPKVYDFSGRTQAGHARIRFRLSEGHVLEMTTLEMEFTPHPVLSGLTALNYLSGFPYGCVEQTMNSFIPMASYYEAMGSVDLNPGNMIALQKKIERGVTKLEGFQRTDGSFGWWRGSEGDLYMTSLVLLGLSKIKEMGIKGVDILISKAAKYLRREITRTRLMDVMAFGLYALSEAGFHHESLLRTLTSNIQSMDALPLSFTILALANHGMAEEVGKAADQLMVEMEKGPDGAFFPDPDPYGRRNSIEATAFALIALLRASPRYPESDEILRWLVVQKTGQYWVSTKTTGLVILALSEYLKTKKGEIPLEDQTIALSLNGEKTSEFQIKRTEYLKGKVQVVSIPSSSLIHGLNVLDIKGEHDLYYALRVKSFLESDRITPASYRCEMPLSKKLYSITRVHDSRGNPRILSRAFEPDEKLQVGDEIRIEIRFTPDRDYEYFILEDGLPSGFEVVDFEKDTGLRWWEPYAQKERRDDKVVFFFNRLQKGREITTDYILRSELNGEFHLPPARLFGMYQPTVYTHSGSQRLRVGSFPKILKPVDEKR